MVLRDDFRVERTMDQSGWRLKVGARGGGGESLLATSKFARQVPSVMFVCGQRGPNCEGMLIYNWQMFLWVKKGVMFSS